MTSFQWRTKIYDLLTPKYPGKTIGVWEESDSCVVGVYSPELRRFVVMGREKTWERIAETFVRGMR